MCTLNLKTLTCLPHLFIYYYYHYYYSYFNIQIFIYLIYIFNLILYCFLPIGCNLPVLYTCVKEEVILKVICMIVQFLSHVIICIGLMMACK
jgi:hypothetical protein